MRDGRAEHRCVAPGHGEICSVFPCPRRRFVCYDPLVFACVSSAKVSFLRVVPAHEIRCDDNVGSGTKPEDDVEDGRMAP
jgi:hypothetical protein